LLGALLELTPQLGILALHAFELVAAAKLART
jgi:hypothetical protein